MKLVKSIIIVLVIFSIFFSFGYAISEPKPVLYGQVFNGNNSADGANVTIYLQSNSSDNITFVVGNGINSSYWKGNLNNLNRDVQNGDVIIIHITNGQNETSRSYIVNLNDINVSL